MPSPITFLPIAILGWASGALINYLAEALPYKRKLAAPFCTQCGEHFPLANYLFWPRRCPNCGRKRSLQTFLIELLAVIFALWLWAYPPNKLGFILALALLIYFGVVAVIDLRYRLILHPTSIAGAVLGLLIGSYLNGLPKTILGGVVGFGIMFAFYYLGAWLARIVAKRRGETIEDGEALGFGDVNLSGVLGLLLGWPAIVVGLFFAILIGAVISLIYMLVMVLARRYRLFSAIPYGPFLIAGAAFILFFRDFLLLVLPK